MKKPKTRVTIDIDDVLFPWASTIHEYCRSQGLHNVDAWSGWHMWEDYGCTRDEFWDTVNIGYLNGVLRNTEPFPGSQEALQRLIDSKVKINLCTARGSTGPLLSLVREDTVKWLAFFNIPHSSLTFTMDKTLLGADYALDDKPENVKALRDAGIEAWLMDQPHNRSADWQWMPRVENLDQFVDIVLGVN